MHTYDKELNSPMHVACIHLTQLYIQHSPSTHTSQIQSTSNTTQAQAHAHAHARSHNGIQSCPLRSLEFSPLRRRDARLRTLLPDTSRCADTNCCRSIAIPRRWRAPPQRAV